jgi:protoheme IX farnesyltransferase
LRVEPIALAQEALTTKRAIAFTDLLSLTKPRLSGLVLFTAAGGMWLSGRALSLTTWVLTLLGTAGTVAAANAFNCYWERDIDALMTRTQGRPLPTGRLEPTVALAFAWLLTAVSLPLLFIGANALTALLGIMAMASYVLLYTPLKGRTHWAIVVGAVPGALPPLMGWTAATGTVSASGWALFMILFVWQLPHSLAIALFRKQEYARAGLTNVPLELGDDAARIHALIYVTLLWPISMLPYATGIAGSAYVVAAAVLGIGFWGTAFYGQWKKLDSDWARLLFRVSLIYLTGLFLALGLDGGLR